MQRIKYLAGLCYAIVCMSSCVTTKLKLDKVPLEKHFKINPVFAESHSGLVVYDLEKDKVIYDYNGQRHFTPASNTKLLTYFAAISMLADSIPALMYCQSKDTLYFTGTSDPTFLYKPFDYGKTVDFLLENEQTLVYIPRAMADDRFGPGWAWDDYPYYFSAEKSSFPIYGNMAYFNKDLYDDYMSVVPERLEDHVMLRQDILINSPTISRKETSNEFELNFNGAPFEFEDAVPFLYSDQLFIDLLSDTLDREVITLDRFPSCNAELLYSVPTDSVSKYILINSDNFLAEQMLLTISNQLGDTLSSQRAIEAMLNDQLTSIEKEINWIDGSGLSRYNQVTPHAMIYVLKRIYQEVPTEKLYDMLPTAGESGTLKNAFGSLSGKIHAKTGSMSHVYNLSGYMQTNSGKTLLFSFMNNNFDVSFSELKQEMEKVLTVFIENK